MKILCINLDSDTESWRLSQEQFARVGLTVERLSATVGDNRPLAFNKSVYRAMLECKRPIEQDFHSPDDWGPEDDHLWPDTEYEYDDLLLFEDDVVFDCGPFSPAFSWQELFDTILPKDYLTCHLGCNIIGTDTMVWQMPTPYNQHLARLWNCWQSHATLYSAECVKYILDNFKYVTDEYKTEGLVIFDEWLRTKVLPMGRSYVMKPMIAYQRPRHSEIWSCHADYTGCHKQGNKYLAQL